ncbi:MAG: amino acid ABC transporter permease [Acidimicrobiia bacterium]
MDAVATTAVSTRPPLWRDLRVLRVVAQVMAVAVVGAVIYILWFNLTNNLRRQGISSDFDFLDQPIGVNIAGSNVGARANVRSALLVGLKNTAALGVVGLPILTVLGVLIGIARLSTNWVVSKLAALYVELFRNLPPLLIIIFAFRAVVLRLPPAREPATPFDWFIISNLSITVPGFTAVEGFAVFWLVVGLAVVAAAAVWWWRTRVFDRTGAPHHRVLWSGGLIVAVAAAAYFAIGRPVRLSLPVLDGRAISGGFTGFSSFFAVMGALALYTASHVAEIVRGSIQAVPRGQGEAANALALSGFQRMRHVVLPQAMRIAIPPTINQYLNYVKNTSLAIAVGFADYVAIAFQAIGNGQPAPQVILLVMAGYLFFSLLISLVVNILNRRLQLVTQ